MHKPINAAGADRLTRTAGNDNGSETAAAANLALRDLMGLLADAYVATLMAQANDNRAVADRGLVR